jgi:hypothetical protein
MVLLLASLMLASAPLLATLLFLASLLLLLESLLFLTSALLLASLLLLGSLLLLASQNNIRLLKDSIIGLNPQPIGLSNIRLTKTISCLATIYPSIFMYVRIQYFP